MSIEAGKIPGTFVTDWDETITDGAKQTSQCWNRYAYEAAREIGISETKFQDEMNRARTEVLAHPESYGWTYQGKIVAPATADKYILSRTCTDMAANNLRVPFSDDTLQKIFISVSQQLIPIFKNDAAEYLRDLDKHTNLIVGTNSSTARVQREAQMLLGDNSLRIMGGMQKNVLSTKQKPIYVKELSRPVYPEREVYGKFLDSLEGPVRVGGDSWELDLTSAEKRKMKTYLVPSVGTPSWEINRYRNHRNGHSVSSLQELKK